MAAYNANGTVNDSVPVIDISSFVSDGGADAGTSACAAIAAALHLSLIHI